MFKLTKRTLAAAGVALAAIAPAAASARVDFNPPLPSVTSGQAQSAIVPSGRATASSPEGFQWDDAGIGAAATAVLVGAGAAASGAGRRRRTHRTAIS
jgi:hypothetical protein